MPKDYYKILGINKGASDDDIKRTYRKLAHEYHPDKPGGNAEKFKEINEAYQVLSDKQKRTQYDRFGATFDQAGPGGGFGGFNGGYSSPFDGFQDFSDIFDMFGGKSGRHRAHSPFEDIFGGGFNGFSGEDRAERGDDIMVDMNITLEEASKGAEKIINLYKGVKCDKCAGKGAEPGSSFKKCEVCKGKGKIEERQNLGFFSFARVRTCPTCYGRGETPTKKCSKCGGDGRVKTNQSIKIQIPAGIDSEEILNITGQGEAGLYGAMAGNLFVRVRVLPHRHFKRRGNDLIYQQVISFTQAVLGDKIKIPTLEGNTELKIPAGIESGEILRVESAGIQGPRKRGDLLVEIKIRTPKHISAKVKKILEDLKENL